METKEFNWQKFEKHLFWHDWYYQFADDERSQKVGKKSEEKINAEFAEAQNLDKSRALALWNRHAPKEFKVL